MPAIEFIKFKAADVYIQDQSSAKPLFDLAGPEGFISLYYGLQREDKKTGIFSVVWESYEHHKKFMDGPKAEKSMELLAPLFAGIETLIHEIKIQVDPTAALTAPITEIAYLKPKECKFQEPLETIREYVEVLNAYEGIYAPNTWGEISQNTTS